MKILITGAGGFLGTEVTKQLNQKFSEYEIHSVSRSKYDHLNNYVHTQHSCNLGDHKKVEELLTQENFDAIFHIAGKVAMWGDWNDFYNTNVLATKNLANLANKLNVKYFVYTSSPSVVFGEESIEGSDESIAYPQVHRGMYGKSKRLSEEWLLSKKWNFQTVALRPHLILGKGDKNLIPRIVDKNKKKMLKIIGDGQNQVDIIDVRNAADAHIKALEAMMANAQLTNEAFFLGQGPIKIWEFINQVLENKGQERISKNISFSLAYKIGTIFEFIFKLLGIKDREPPMTRFVALQLAKSHYFSHEKAKRLLNWSPKYSVQDLLKEL
ncbi:MAG: NAD-dependent epimerase/dehydratase family protein [Oligoflexia bacterium]|nr:NAD-dependent epimerase/dehydratase family protein [Oligoflexia bacterium]